MAKSSPASAIVARVARAVLVPLGLRLWVSLCLAACHASTSPAAASAAPANVEPASALTPCPDDLYELDQRVDKAFRVPERTLSSVDTCVPMDARGASWAITWRVDGDDPKHQDLHRDVLRPDGTIVARAPAQSVFAPSYFGGNGSDPDRVVSMAAMDLDGDRVDEWIEIDSHTDFLDNFTETLTAYRVADGALTPLAPGLQVGQGQALFASCWASLVTNGRAVSMSVEWSDAPGGCLTAGDHALRYADGALTIE